MVEFNPEIFGLRVVVLAKLLLTLELGAAGVVSTTVGLGGIISIRSILFSRLDMVSSNWF